MKMPFLSIPDRPLSSTTQGALPIADIVEDIILFRDGGAAVVLESTSLNFGLLSEKEQEAVIAAYAALINSLSFATQIVIRTQRKDISSYIQYLDDADKRIRNHKLSILMQSYRRFILESIKKKNVLGKRFYIIVPLSPLELGVAKTVVSLAKQKGPLPYPKSYVVKKAKIILYPRRDHLMRQSGRLGLKLRQLTTKEVVELLFAIFNPEPPGTKKTDQLEGEVLSS